MNDRERYHRMFNAATDALEAMAEQNFGVARKILVAAQQDAEESFLRETDGEERPETKLSEKA